MSNLHDSLLDDSHFNNNLLVNPIDENNERSQMDISIFEENDFSEFSQEQEITEHCLYYAIPIFKLMIFFPGKIMRLLFQIGDFYYLLQILSIAFEYITILLVSCSEFPKVFQVIYILVAFLFSCLMGDILAIPMWELVQMRWINNKNPLQTFFNIFNLNDYFTDYYGQTIYFIEKITNFLCSIFFYNYLFCILDYFHSTGEKFNMMNSVFLFFVPSIKFFIIYFSYILKEILFFFVKRNKKNETNKFISIITKSRSNDPFVIAMVRCKDIFNKNYEETDERPNTTKKYSRMFFFFIFKLTIISLQFIFLIYFIIHYKIKAAGVIFCLFVFFYISWFSLFISMPIWFFHIFQSIKCCSFVQTKRGIKLSKEMIHNFKGFKNVCFVCQMLPFLIVFILFLFFCSGFNKKATYFSRIEDTVKWDGQISGKYPYISPITSVKSSMCYTSIHGLNLIQIASIAAAPYYNDLDNYKKFIKNSFFKDSSFDINLSFVRNEDNHAVLLRADFDDIDSNKKLTIFSIRGSSTSNDWWLDIEMFVASAMLTVAKWIPFMQKQEGFTVKIVTDFMTLPLNLMVKATLTYRYTSEMFEPINEFLNNPKNSDRSVMFTGHSLGGGLSKVLAYKYEIQSVAVSGPGITPVENHFRNSSNYDLYFKSKLIDIVPDRDLVPRFEISGGTRHRVLCKKNLGECHNILRTVCQMGISCNDEYHVGDFCSHAFSQKEYENMKKLANI